MKRFLSFFSAMFIFIASFYVFIIPAYADEIVPYEGTTSVSIWDEAFDEYFDALTHFYSDFTDDWKLNDLTVTGFQRKSVEYMVTKAGIASDSFTFDAIVDYICANPADFDISYQFDWLAGYGNIVPGADTIEAIQNYVTDTYYQVPSAAEIQINGHIWLQVSFPYYVDFSPYNVTITEFKTLNSGGNFSGDVSSSVYVTRIGNNTAVCSWVAYNSSSATALFGRGNNSNYISNVSGRFAIDGVNYLCGQVSSRYPSGISSQYSDFATARSDFYGNFDSHTGGSGDPVSNGDVYVGNEIDLNADLPSIINNDFSQLSEYYYNTYGDTYPDADIDNNYYYNYYNYVIDYSGDFSVPYWLINGSDIVYTFSDPSSDYDLSTIELADNELPSSYNMGWYQDIWDSLPSDVTALFGIILASTIGVGLLKS